MSIVKILPFHSRIELLCVHSVFQCSKKFTKCKVAKTGVCGQGNALNEKPITTIY